MKDIIERLDDADTCMDAVDDAIAEIEKLRKRIHDFEKFCVCVCCHKKTRGTYQETIPVCFSCYTSGKLATWLEKESGDNG